MISKDLIGTKNEAARVAHEDDYGSLGRQLARRGVEIETLTARAMAWSVAIPTWGVGTGGTRFARFPGLGEPRNIHDKLADCGVIQALTKGTRTVSPHIPWDKVSDYNALRQEAASYDLGFDAINSNTFQDQLDQEATYKFGSLAAADPKARALAVAHNIECIEIGKALGSGALTVWVGDGTNFPGQQSLGGMFRNYLEAMGEIYAALPPQMSMFIEHKMYEPAFYSTVISDWGSSLMAAQALGPQAKCLVDLGHHAPNTNIEQIVARLIHVGRLAGFHFNDSKYGDDDLDAGSVDPFRLFLVFNELVEAEGAKGFDPAYMIDQSHNVTDPIESLMGSAIEIARAYVQASLVDRKALAEAQAANDVLGAHRILKAAYLTDVSPILAEARVRQGGAHDPIATYRASGYRAEKAEERPMVKGASSGIV
ncbi:L-rhamnose catabolism isomerase [Stagnihabitans tardus]|uniref:L-rhamnose catabolism isomerase n=1 Tax=Stagnihabitans tardus TaxID=2699202 RepID=A0AAE5BUS1_9RHOB|nr:L-rhamnose catabolism isomerase [Stagnihabitans tardus]NBZ87079.1 L-rhamnose catabolism isomerase [Stagnihabitans tardus]